MTDIRFINMNACNGRRVMHSRLYYLDCERNAYRKRHPRHTNHETLFSILKNLTFLNVQITFTRIKTRHRHRKSAKVIMRAKIVTSVQVVISFVLHKRSIRGLKDSKQR